MVSETLLIAPTRPGCIVEVFSTYIAYGGFAAENSEECINRYASPLHEAVHVGEVTVTVGTGE